MIIGSHVTLCPDKLVLGSDTDSIIHRDRCPDIIVQRVVI